MRVPTFERYDRMRKALEVANLSVGEMAQYLDVTRGTVSTWINGRIEPSTQTMRLWALRTGVPFEWLRDGDTTDDAAPHSRPEVEEAVDASSAATPRRRAAKREKRCYYRIARQRPPERVVASDRDAA